MRLSGPPAPPPRADTVGALLERAAASRSGVTFVDLREREVFLPWREVWRRARRAAAALAAAGVGPGDRVAIVLRTEPSFLDAFFGALLAGAVPAPLYPPVRLARMEEYLAATARMVSVSGARAIVAGGAVRRLLGEVVARARPALGCLPADALASGERELARPAARDDLALVQFSSGSTVDPKPVALTHGAVVTHVEALLALLQPGGADALVSWLPLYHDMGLIGGLMGALAHPGPAVLVPPEHFLARPAIWLRALSRHRGTIAAAPSFAYGYCVQRVRDADLEGVDLSAWRVALNGAEPVSLAVAREFQRRFAPFGFRPEALRPVYGLSEAALAVTFCEPRAEPRGARVDPAALAAGEIRPGDREVASVGRPIPGVEIELRDASGRGVGEDHLGRIFVRGPSLMRGYLGQEAATARALDGGWLDTGDLGFARDGELYVHGRAKDVVVVRGANHAPDEFEGALAGVEDVRPGCSVACGLDADGRGEELVLLVERARGARRTDLAIRDAVRQAVTERTGVTPHTVVVLAPGSLPRTSSGKMRRAEALSRWQAGTLAPPRPVTPLAIARAMARSALAYARAARRGEGG